MAPRGIPFSIPDSARPREVADPAESRISPGADPSPAEDRNARRAARRRRRSRGQGLVEFAISFPVVLLMVLFGVDFGRVFLGWLALTNAAREAANFAALNPSAWSPVNATVQTEYRRLITAEAAQINCTLPATLPDPSFPNGDGIGSPAVVSLTCEFSLITPIIGGLIGNPIDVSASAAFPIRSGVIEGVPVSTTIPSGSLSWPSTGPTPAPTGTTVPTATPIPTPSQIPTPIPMCTVPNLVSPAVRTNQAGRRWTDNGFSANNLIFSPAVPPHYNIATQSLTPLSSQPCDSIMTVTQN